METRSPRSLRARLRQEVELDLPVAGAFALWTRYEELGSVLESVRRVKTISDRRQVWDVDVLGRQLVWEAQVVEETPPKRIRWVWVWGTPNSGSVGFEPLPGDRTRMVVEIDYEPRGCFERWASRLGAVDWHVARDLSRFRRHAAARAAAGQEPQE